MSKPRTRWSYSTYLRRLKEGRGTGTGPDYKPWITIHDFASKGSCSRIYGRKSKRIHHLMSHLESDLFILFDNNDSVADIREQFPLRLNDTLQLSAKLNIRHPYLPGCDFPFVMTTDFLITMNSQSLRAYSVKPSGELDKKRTVEKLMLEKAYWDRLQIPWKIVTEKEINRGKAANLRWLYYGNDVSDSLLPEQIATCSREFLLLYQDLSIPFPYILEILEDGFSLPQGTGMAIYKYMIKNRQITIDLEQRIDLSEPRKRGDGHGSN